MTDDECQVEPAGMCDCGPLLTDAQVSIGASVAVPFSLGRHQVHLEGTIASMVPSLSEVNVAFPGERSWVVARDRIFAVVPLAGRDERHDHGATAAARGSIRVVNGDDEMMIRRRWLRVQRPSSSDSNEREDWASGGREPPILCKALREAGSHRSRQGKG